jgi:glycosyltransferase involved in cell wall biosynthesis
LSELRVLALTRYGELGASSRLRFLQYLPRLRDDGISVEVSPLFADDALQARYTAGSHRPIKVAQSFSRRIGALVGRHRFDLLWIEKECLPWAPLWVERLLLRNVPYALDFDDAIFHNYDLHASQLVRRLLGSRVDQLMADAALVVGGNAYLANRARRAGASRVEMLPTVIDLDRYPSLQQRRSSSSEQSRRLVWIGSPATAHYLELLAQPLRTLRERLPFKLRVIGARVRLPGVDVEELAWTDATEVESIAACDVGLMPLLDSPWERGKCGYKLVQYMACGLPVVASPVGVNSDLVNVGINGFLAATSEEWVSSLERLLREPDLCRSMGIQGRRMVEADYCLQVTAPKLAVFLRHAAARGV